MTTSPSFHNQASDLLTSLKEIIDKQHTHNLYLEATIENLTNQIAVLTSQNEHFCGRVEQLELELSNERSKSRRHKRKTSLSRKPSTSSIDENRVPSISSNSTEGMIPKSNSVSRSNSFQRKLLEEREGSMKEDYELSSDLKDRQVEAIRNFYGGSEKSERAARIIQYAYRKYQMRRNFNKIRHSSTRRRLTIDCIKEVDLPRVDSSEETVVNHQNEKSCSSDTEVCYHQLNTEETPPSEQITTNGQVNHHNDDTLQLEDCSSPSPGPISPSPDDICVVETSFAKVVQSSKQEDDTNNGDDAEKIAALNALDDALLEVSEEVSTTVVEDNIPSIAIQPSSDPTSPTDHLSPPTEEELVRRILENDPVMPYMDPNSNLFKNRKQRKRHGYETVADITIPTSPTTPGITSPTFAIVSSPPSDTTSSNDTPVGDVSCQNSNENSQPTPRKEPPRRTSSDNSLHSTEVEGDRESIKSYDTSSITSESASTTTSVSTSEQGYHRRSTISRESWHVENDVLRKRLYRIGLNLFNRKPTKGLDFLIDKQFVVRTAPAIANFLLNRKGLSRQMVGEYLGSPQRFCRDVLDAVCELMDFNDMDIDQALRHFQSQIRVQGEAQKVERLIEAFSQRYCTCNPKRLQNLKNPDSIFIAAFAIIMLNTDLHSPNMKNERRMTEAGFIKNLRGIDNGNDLNEDMLLNVYNRIKESELVTLDDHVSQVLQVENSIVGKKPTLAIPHRRLVCFCRLFQVHDPNKPQKAGLHQREVFLFNDMILITKMLQKKKLGTTYTFKHSLSLHGLSFLLFETPHYPNGVRLVNAMDNKSLMAFNAPNETDRKKFVNDLRESIAEVEQMEGMRIGAELEKAHTSGMSPSESRRSSLSLVDTKKISASMSNLNPNGTVNLKQAIGPNIRPTSMYAMGGVNLNNNSNNNNKNTQPKNDNTTTTTSSTTSHRLPSVIGNFLSSNRQRHQQGNPPRRIFNHRSSSPALNSVYNDHHKSSPSASPKLATYNNSSSGHVFIPHSEV